jgi:Prokaryotic E2 family E
MSLLAEDEARLTEKGFRWELLPEARAEQLLVLRGVTLAAGKYDRAEVDVLVKIPPGYPVASLDMFWVHPELHLANGTCPPSANCFEEHEGRKWQRFSRHLRGWRPGIDSLDSFLRVALKELVEA